ncbi:MAG: tetratricopeptide repeat protein [Thermoguttaceae bacterium]|nr:tetratricopeptide repeat protein [Thermoguttaceae bacterium]MDW8078657.1 tetratricopeptide repeat protein [Thermoguttaceae bacterium]
MSYPVEQPLGFETASCLLEQAEHALEAGDYRHALELTDQILPLAHQIPEVWRVRAKALAFLHRPVDAVEAARRFASTQPGDVSAQWELAQYAWRAGRLGLAQQAMEKAIFLSGQDPQLFAEYAWFLAFERGPRIAEEIAQQAVQLAPNSSTAWAALGLSQLRRHRLKEAEASLGRALRLDPNDPCAQCAMLFLLREERQNEKALALSKILEDTPGTEPIINSIRREATRRMIATKLVERGVELGSARHAVNWRRTVIWGLGAFVAGWMTFIFQAKDPLTIGLCVGLPLLFTLILDRILGD